MPQHVLSKQCGREGRTVAHGAVSRSCGRQAGGCSPQLKQVGLQEGTGKALAAGKQHSRS